MPDVIWSLGASSVTFPKGVVRGPHKLDTSRVVTGRTAGGKIVSYELGGVSALETLEYALPHVTEALRAQARTFKDQVAKDALNPFTLTDNSQSPALVKTVRLMGYQEVPENWTNPAAPRWTLRGQVTVEPS